MEQASDTATPERVCERCARVASRWSADTDGTVICGDCMDEHERALDAALDAAWGDLPSGVQDYYDERRDRFRSTLATAIKAYIEWPGA